jgi:hypothetical protein
MRENIRKLTEFIPPVQNSHTAMINWESSRREIGFDFPADFREFIDTYGWGGVDEYFHVHKPWEAVGRSLIAGGFSFFVEYMGLLIEPAGYDALRTEYPDYYPYPLFPEAGGLLAWAHNDNSDVCFWLTEGTDSDKWPVVFWDKGRRAGEEWRRFDCGMVEFLFLGLSGQREDLSLLPLDADPRLWTQGS